MAANRRRNPADPKRLWELHHEVLRRRFLGQRVKDIADAVGLTPQRVSQVLNSPLAQEKLRVMRAEADGTAVDVAKRIAELAPKAVAVLDKLLDGNNGVSPAVRASAAKDILDRAGFSPVRRFEGRIASAVLTPKMLAEIRKRSANARGEAVVVDTQEVSLPPAEPEPTQ
jgi:predicted transcriptional regulator